jgi:hypothetical protein
MTTQVIYAANGASTVFSFPFAIETTADCQVLVDGVLLTGGYAIRGQASIDGGAVVFDAPPAAGTVVTLRYRGSVTVTAADAVLGQLADKVVAGTNIAVETVTEAGGAQHLRIDGPDTSAFLRKDANLSDLSDKAAARANLEVYSSAEVDAAVALAAGNPVAFSVVAAAGQESLVADSANDVLTLAAGDNIRLTTDAAADKVTIGVTGLGTAAFANLGTGAGQIPTADQISTIARPLFADGNVSRDQLALMNLRLLVHSTVASGPLIGGYQWKLDSNEWAAGSSAYTYVAGWPDYYGNLGGLSGNVCTGGTAMANVSGPYANVSVVFDGNVAPTSTNNMWGGNAFNSPASWVAYDLGAGNAKDIRQVNFLPGISDYIPAQVSVRCSDDGVNWTSVATRANELDPKGEGVMPGTMRTIAVPPSGSHRYWGLFADTTSTIIGGSAAFILAEVQMMGFNAPTNMTLVSPVINVGDVPAQVHAYFLWKDDSGSAVLGNDLTVELSRDGGITWMAAAPSMLVAFDGIYGVVKASADLSALASGAMVKARIKTLNAKAQRVGAFAFYVN